MEGLTEEGAEVLREAVILEVQEESLVEEILGEMILVEDLVEVQEALEGVLAVDLVLEVLVGEEILVEVLVEIPGETLAREEVFQGIGIQNLEMEEEILERLD